MRQNSVTKSLLLSTLKVNDLDSYKKAINNLIKFLIFLGLSLSFIAMFLVYHNYEKKSQIVNKKLLINANSILQSNISEKLSILVNNQDFVSYINEGEYSRELNNVGMMLLFNKFIDNDLIAGIRVTNNDDKSILTIGGVDIPWFVKLNLCYLNGQINNQYGNCYANLTLYFSKESYLKQLAKINSNISLCETEIYTCDNFNPFNTASFGSFSIIDAGKEVLSLRQVSPNVYQLLIPAIIISIISTIAITARFHKHLGPQSEHKSGPN